jgi:hypothetical protein
MGAGMVQTRTPFQTSLQVLERRSLAKVEQEVLRMATLLGDDAFYGWGSGKNHVEGGTIYLANALIHIYRNAVVVSEPVQDMPEAWIFTHTWLDLESQTSTTRQFIQSKREEIPGSMDKYRKEQIRFGKGQSKAIRNIILNNIPQYLVTKAIETAKNGARSKMQKYIEDKGIAKGQEFVVASLAKVGVKEEHILAKMGKAKIEGLDIDDLVGLSADFRAIDTGNANASELFDLSKPASSAGIDIKDKLKAKVDGAATTPPAAGKKLDPEVKIGDGIQVRLGAKPFTWFVTDGVSEYLVSQSDGAYICNCKPRCTDCAHVAAAQRFAAQA